jgi:8-oxo-dGTP diphosphatase
VPRAAVLTQAKNRVQVAAGILQDNKGRVLIADRTRANSMREFWEFPGGKLLPGETPVKALHRELAEELGICVESFAHFHSLEHEYPDFVVVIDFYLVDDWSGEPAGLEGQQLSWVVTESLNADLLLPADAAVVDLLCSLPVFSRR